MSDPMLALPAFVVDLYRREPGAFDPDAPLAAHVRRMVEAADRGEDPGKIPMTRAEALHMRVMLEQVATRSRMLAIAGEPPRPGETPEAARTRKAGALAQEMSAAALRVVALIAEVFPVDPPPAPGA